MKLIVLNGFPKSGNHILWKIAEGYNKKQYVNLASPFGKIVFCGNKEDDCWFWRTHLSWSEKASTWMNEHGMKQILILRDLKDAVSSMYRAVMQGDGFHPQYQPYIDLPKDEFLKIIMEGIPGEEFRDDCSTVRWFDNRWLRWNQEPNCLVTSFEKLIGSNGGGNDKTQLDELKIIFEFMGLEKNEPWFEHKASLLYDETAHTFFEDGKIGSYKEVFSDVSLQHYTELTGNKG